MNEVNHKLIICISKLVIMLRTHDLYTYPFLPFHLNGLVFYRGLSHHMCVEFLHVPLGVVYCEVQPPDVVCCEVQHPDVVYCKVHLLGMVHCEVQPHEV